VNTSLSDSEKIFSMIKQFQNLRHLSMQNDRLKSIPSYAFNHTYLTNIYFGSPYEYPKQTQPIESIGDYAFDDLPSLIYLYIHSPNLTKITKYAFALRKRFIPDAYGGRGFILSIGGERLNSTSFELTSLSRFRNRRVFIHLYDTNITYLDENIFQPFLESNPFSVVDIGPTNSLFGCDCRSAWIQRDYLRNVYRVEHRVYGYECSKYDFAKYCTINK
jgi:hypothetical protein